MLIPVIDPTKSNLYKEHSPDLLLNNMLKIKIKIIKYFLMFRSSPIRETGINDHKKTYNPAKTVI